MLEYSPWILWDLSGNRHSKIQSRYVTEQSCDNKVLISDTSYDGNKATCQIWTRANEQCVGAGSSRVNSATLSCAEFTIRWNDGAAEVPTVNQSAFTDFLFTQHSLICPCTSLLQPGDKKELIQNGVLGSCQQSYKHILQGISGFIWISDISC